MLTLSTSNQQAQMLFQQALEEPNTVKMLIFGNSSVEAEIAKKAEIRAAVLPVRRAIWVQDLQILSAAEEALYRQANDAISVCTIDVSGQPAAFLQSDEAQSMTKLERAFVAAEQAHGNEARQ